MPQRLHSQIDTHLAHQSHFHSERLSEHTTLLEAIKTNTSETTINAGDIEVNVQEVEDLITITNDKLDTINTTLTAGGVVDISTLSTHALQTAIHDRQDDQLGHLNTAQLKLVSLDTNFSLHKTANNTHLENIYTRQDDILTSCNASKLSNATTASKMTSLESTNHTDLNNIYSRQDDILTSNNATKSSSATTASKMTSLESTNHTDLDNIFSRQDDILTSCNATKSSSATTASKMTSLESTNHTDLDNIFSRQDDILTSCNAVKTNTQSVENCVSSNKMNVNISSGNISGFATAALQGTTHTILGDLATESTLNIIAEEFTKCDTDNVIITGGGFDGAVTNAHLTELGTAINSAKLDVNISSGGFDGAVTNAPLTNLDAAINSNRLDVNISSGGFDGAVTNAHLTELGTAINSAKLDVNISSGGFDGAVTNAHLTELGTAINSAKLDVNISSGGFGGAVTNAHLTELGTAINSAKLDVNISSGGFDGAVTNAPLTNLDAAINSNRLDVNIDNGGFDGAVTNAHLTELGTAINSAKLDVNISSGGFGGAVTNAGLTALDAAIGTDGSSGPAKCISIGGTNLLGGAIQEIACDGDGHLQIDILSSALPSGAATDISNSAIAASTAIIATKTTLATTSELKELLSGVTINAGALSSEFDTENYEKIRFFGETTAAVGNNFSLMGSNASGGTFYHMGESLRDQTVGSTHYIYGANLENLPRYIKIINTHGSTDFEFTKFFMQLSGGRLAV